MSNQLGIDVGTKIIQRIRNSPDPMKTIDMMLDIIERLSTGEAAERIKGSYGSDWEKYIKCNRNAPVEELYRNIEGG